MSTNDPLRMAPPSCKHPPERCVDAFCRNRSRCAYDPDPDPTILSQLIERGKAEVQR